MNLLNLCPATVLPLPAEYLKPLLIDGNKNQKKEYIRMKNFDSKLYKRRSAYHEAGHAIMLVIFYEKIQFARISSFYSDEENLGFVRSFDENPVLGCKCQSQHRKYTESKILINLAGYVAQFLYPAQKIGWSDLHEYFYSILTEKNNSTSDYGRVLQDLKSLTIFDIVDNKQAGAKYRTKI